MKYDWIDYDKLAKAPTLALALMGLIAFPFWLMQRLAEVCEAVDQEYAARRKRKAPERDGL